MKTQDVQILLWLHICVWTAMCTSSPIVQTNSGPVIGTTARSISGKVVSMYLGIPYAEPPVGELRFRPPVPVVPWKTTLEAVKPPAPPHQHVPDDLAAVNARLGTSIPKPWTEDCLKLHLWVPKLNPDCNTVGYPVVVFIHGGAFISESALWFIDGSNFAADENVLFASVEYRLGVFGFLYLGHEEAPGNVGLMDQQLALDWIQKNIGAFGGDPRRVTVMGTSAGGASIGYHLLSPGSRDLFQRAILMSGVPTNVWAYSSPRDSRAMAEDVLRNTGCNQESIEKGVACLRSKTPEELLSASQTQYYLASQQLGPTVDGTFLQQPPSEFSTIQHPADVLLGSTTDEGGEFLLILKQELAEKPVPGLTLQDFEELVQLVHPTISDQEKRALGVLYRNWSKPDDPELLYHAANHLFTDILFTCNINLFADILSQDVSRRVYRYVYDHKVTPFWFPNVTWTRSVHAADQLISIGAVDEPEDPSNFAARTRLVKHYANFARTGDPSLSQEDFPSEGEWPAYRSSTRSYKVIGGEGQHTQDNLRIQACSWWLNLLPLFRK